MFNAHKLFSRAAEADRYLRQHGKTKKYTVRGLAHTAWLDAWGNWRARQYCLVRNGETQRRPSSLV